MNTRKIIFVVVFIALIMTVSGCKEAILTNEIDADWVSVDKEWKDSVDQDKAHLSYVDGTPPAHLDIMWNDTPSDSNAEIFGYIDTFTYKNGTLHGKYTSDDNVGNENTEYDITLTFSYSSPILTVEVDADGVIGKRTLTLISAT